jgi:hypothetical protein
VTISSLTVGNSIPVSWKKVPIFEACRTEIYSRILLCEGIAGGRKNFSKYLDRSFIDAQVSKFQLQRVP